LRFSPSLLVDDVLLLFLDLHLFSTMICFKTGLKMTLSLDEDEMEMEPEEEEQEPEEEEQEPEFPWEEQWDEAEDDEVFEDGILRVRCNHSSSVVTDPGIGIQRSDSLALFCGRKKIRIFKARIRIFVAR
jgi:hypothetical protein